MSKITTAATLAAVSVLFVSAGIYADPSFALGSAESVSELKADTIKVDAGILAADQNFLKTITSADVRMTVQKNGDVEFAPGIGETLPMDVPQDDEPVVSDEAETQEAPETNDIKASSLAELVRAQNTSGALSKEQHCLAAAVYFESKSESLTGQLAVAKVVMARAKSGRFPSTLCGVVYQKSQFSFVSGGGMPYINKGHQQWKNAVAITKIAQSGSWKSPVEGALFFHARRVSPGWNLKRIGNVDNHVFYR
jgi:N-acetylmuramoyl-L-alanine amidase